MTDSLPRSAYVRMRDDIFSDPDPDATDVEIAPGIYANTNRQRGRPTAGISRLTCDALSGPWRAGMTVDEVADMFEVSVDDARIGIVFECGAEWERARRNARRRKKG